MDHIAVPKVQPVVFFRFKTCPRCKGDLYRSILDEEPDEYTCLQCGNRIPITAFDMDNKGAELVG